MKKLTAGIFTVMLGIVAANSADAAVASRGYVDQEVGKKQDTLKVEGVDANLAGSNGIDVKIVDGKITIDGTGTKYDDSTLKQDIEANKNAIAGHTTSIGENKTAIDGLKTSKEDSANKETTYNKDATDKAVKFPTVAVAEEIAKAAAGEVSTDLTTLEGRVATNETNIGTNTNAITKLNADKTTEGSVDYKIDAATTTITNAYTAADTALDGKITEAKTQADKGVADAATAKSAADAAQKTANDAIPKPQTACDDPNNDGCALVYRNSAYVWEIIERAENENQATGA